MRDQSEPKPSAGGPSPLELPPRTVAAVLNETALLHGLLAAGAGYQAKATGRLHGPTDPQRALFVFCVKGGGWCEMSGRCYLVREGDLVVLPPGVPHTCGAHLASPWTIHWVQALGTQLPEYLVRLGVSAREPVVRIGEDLQLARLFNEVAGALGHGFSWVNVLHASQALAHLLALAIRHCHERVATSSDGAEKVGQAIIYMSEHLDEPLRVSALAALANLSQAHFTELFKEQAGCAPRDYLHLLRMHVACRWLHNTTWSVKEIASRLGYQDPFHFSRQFKAFEGVAPTEYRERQILPSPRLAVELPPRLG